MDKPLWGLRVDGPLGRRFLRGLSLTRLWREGCCRAPLNYRRRPLMKKPLQPPCGRRKTGQPRSARGNAFPLWWLAPPPCPVGSMSLDSRVAGLPYESSSCATPSSKWHNNPCLLQSRLRSEASRCFILSPGWGGKGTRFVREQSDLRIV